MLTLVRLDAGTAPGRQLGRAADAVELRSAATIVSQIGPWSMPWRRASIINAPILSSYSGPPV
eukprot:4309585-Prymnesium_polylepis.1